jgi:nitrate reductase molybdenum cofactor assembly chaperone NarJ/NarW
MRTAKGGEGERATLWKLCSLALQYPDGELLEARAQLEAVAAALPPSAAAGALRRFLAWWAREPPTALAEHYVRTFDLQGRCSLYLTYYTHGDRRDRGLALLRLRQLYRAAGLPLAGRELPDYLPVVLEFAAAATPAQGALVVREQRAALELLRTALRDQGSPYEHALDAVCRLAGQLTAGERLSVERLIAQGPPRELVGLEPFAPPEVMPASGARR